MTHPALPTVEPVSISLFIPSQAHDIEATRLIFREYANSLNVDLAFQDFDAELASLPGE